MLEAVVPVFRGFADAADDFCGEENEFVLAGFGRLEVEFHGLADGFSGFGNGEIDADFEWAVFARFDLEETGDGEGGFDVAELAGFADEIDALAEVGGGEPFVAAGFPGESPDAMDDEGFVAAGGAGGDDAPAEWAIEGGDGGGVHHGAEGEAGPAGALRFELDGEIGAVDPDGGGLERVGVGVFFGVDRGATGEGKSAGNGGGGS